MNVCAILVRLAPHRLIGCLYVPFHMRVSGILGQSLGPRFVQVTVVIDMFLHTEFMVFGGRGVASFNL
jgi:hypothetical protein